MFKFARLDSGINDGGKKGMMLHRLLCGWGHVQSVQISLGDHGDFEFSPGEIKVHASQNV